MYNDRNTRRVKWPSFGPCRSSDPKILNAIRKMRATKEEIKENNDLFIKIQQSIQGAGPPPQPPEGEGGLKGKHFPCPMEAIWAPLKRGEALPPTHV